MTNDPSIQAELDALLLPWSDVSVHNMFGGRGYFVGDRLFAAFHKGVVATKLPDPEREDALERHGAMPFMPTPGRRFGNWVEFPVAGPEGVEALIPWLGKGFEYVKMTPPSGRRSRRAG